MMENDIDDPRWLEANGAYNAGEWDHALSLLQGMAADGITQAYDKIGCIYEYGYNGKYGKDRGVKQDYSEALKWYQKAFEAGSASGALGLARVYLASEIRDYGKAFHYLSLLKKYHLPEVYKDLGMLYDTGRGVTQNREKAKLMYLRAIAKGDKGSLVHLGILFTRSGRRVKGYCLTLYGFLKAFALIGHTAWDIGQGPRPKDRHKEI